MDGKVVLAGIISFLALVFVKTGAANGGVIYNIIRGIAHFFEWLFKLLG